MIAQIGPTVQQIETIKPVSVTEVNPGTYIFDMGINMVGTVSYTHLDVYKRQPCGYLYW